MGSSLKKKYNSEKDVILKIVLNKVCYFPGENIEGILDIRGKTTLKITSFEDTSVTIKIVQIQEYQYNNDDEDNGFIKEITNLYEKKTNFDNFKGSNLLTGIQIPFSIPLPTNSQPTFNIGFCRYTKHIL